MIVRIPHKLNLFRSPNVLLLVKVKQSLQGPGDALRVSRGSGSQISRQSTYEIGKVISPTHRPPLQPPPPLPENNPGTDFCQRMNRPQGHSGGRK
jgi:hypothetical protein